MYLFCEISIQTTSFYFKLISSLSFYIYVFRQYPSYTSVKRCSTAVVRSLKLDNTLQRSQAIYLSKHLLIRSPP